MSGSLGVSGRDKGAAANIRDGICLDCGDEWAEQGDEIAICPECHSTNVTERDAVTTRSWKVTLYEGGFAVHAPTEHLARVAAFQTVAESLDLFVVEEEVGRDA